MDMISVLAVAAKKVGIAPALLVAVCHTETNLKNVHNMNDKGSASYGVCQVKHQTVLFVARHYGDREMSRWTEGDLKLPAKNAEAAAKYLKYQLNRYNNNWCAAISAYNAGSAVESKIVPGKPKNYLYVKKVKSKIYPSRPIAHLLSCETAFRGYETK